MGGGRQAAVVAVIGALLVVAGLADREPPERTVATLGERPDFVMPEADPARALSSTWYCPSGTATGDGRAEVTVVIANVSDAVRTGVVRWFRDEGDPAAVPVEIPAWSSVGVAASSHLSAGAVAAMVELDGGQVVVEHQASGPRGESVAPCASAASDEWYLATGVTTRDAAFVLSLFNPFPDDTVVDISFATDEGRDEPTAMQGLPIPARGVRAIDLTEVVRRRGAIATSVVARTGRLVAGSVQTFDGSEGRQGLALALATPSPGEVWMFPAGQVDEGLEERFHVYNPGEREALVDVELVLDEGEVEPIELTVPPLAAVALTASEVERIPAGVPHSVTVRARNDVPVVVQRELVASRPNRQGVETTMGARRAAEAWAFAAGEASDSVDAWLVVQNPGASSLTFSVTALGNGQRIPLDGLQDVSLGPAGRREIRLGDHIRRSPLPLVVEADRPVVVERDLYRVGGRGLSASIGIPLTPADDAARG